MKKMHLTGEQKYNLKGYIFVLPWVIGFILFLAYPLIYSLILSFGKIDDLKEFTLKWVEWDNYTKAFFEDTEFVPKFLDSIKDTLLNTPLVIVYSLFIAILLNKEIKCKGLFRALFFLPVLIGTGVVLQQLVGMELNEHVTSRFGLDPDLEEADMVGAIKASDWMMQYLGPELGDIVQNALNRVTSILWASGIQILIFLGALQNIPTYLYESAYIDGASNWEMFWKITLPMISPVILLNIVFTLINFFTSVDNKVMKYTLEVSFKKIQLGYGSALGWIFFIFVFLIVGLVFLVMKKLVYYQGEK